MAMMGMKICAGRTLCLPLPSSERPHFFVVLTGGRFFQEAKVAIVNLTKVESGRGRLDRTVILVSGEHPFITVDTAVNYMDAAISEAAEMQRMVLNNKADFKEEFSDELLERLQMGALQSKRTPPEVKAMVKAHLGY